MMVSPPNVLQHVKSYSLASSLVALLESLIYSTSLSLTLKGHYLSIPANSILVSHASKKISPIAVSCLCNTTVYCISEIMVFLLTL